MAEIVYQNEVRSEPRESNYCDLESRKTVFYEELNVQEQRKGFKTLSVFKRISMIGGIVVLILVIVQIMIGVMVGLNTSKIRDIESGPRMSDLDKDVRQELIDLMNSMANSTGLDVALEKVEEMRRELAELVTKQTNSSKHELFRLQQILNYLPHYSCYHVYLLSDHPSNGDYILDNGAGDTFTVHCEFLQDRIYTYIAKTDIDININALLNNKAEILVRHKRTNGTQMEAVYGQLSIFQTKKISVQYNSSINYSPIVNQVMYPYIYVGLMNVSEVVPGDINGYSVNGQDFNFTNCDGSTNSYFALLFNAANASTNGGMANGNDYMSRWKTEATVVGSDRTLDDMFFSQFELHFGGCGGYLTSDHLPDVVGVSFGLRFGEPWLVIDGP